MAKGRLAPKAKQTAVRKLTKRPVGDGLTTEELARGAGWGTAPPAPPARRTGPVEPVFNPHKGMKLPSSALPARPLCAGAGCGNIAIWETPGGELCKSCYDRWRGHPDSGVVYHGFARGTCPPFQGYKYEED